MVAIGEIALRVKINGASPFLLGEGEGPTSFCILPARGEQPVEVHIGILPAFGDSSSAAFVKMYHYVPTGNTSGTPEEWYEREEVPAGRWEGRGLGQGRQTRVIEWVVTSPEGLRRKPLSMYNRNSR